MSKNVKKYRKMIEIYIEISDFCPTARWKAETLNPSKTHELKSETVEKKIFSSGWVCLPRRSPSQSSQKLLQNVKNTDKKQSRP